MAWTLTLSQKNHFKHGGYEWFTIKLECISDGNALSDTLFSAISGFDSIPAEARQAIMFGRLMSLTTVPGTGGEAPLAVYTPTIKNGLGASILAPADRSTTVTEIAYPSNLTMMQGTPSVGITDLGDSGDKTTLYLEIWR